MVSKGHTTICNSPVRCRAFAGDRSIDFPAHPESECSRISVAFGALNFRTCQRLSLERFVGWTCVTARQRMCRAPANRSSSFAKRTFQSRLRKAYGAAGYEWTRTREQTTADGRKYTQMISLRRTRFYLYRLSRNLGRYLDAWFQQTLSAFICGWISSPLNSRPFAVCFLMRWTADGVSATALQKI